MIPKPTTVESPQQLRTLLDGLGAAVDAGLLTRHPPREPFDFRGTVAELRSGDNWPDYFALEFSDRAGVRYRLDVETFHGAGGTWERV